jgi:hypothetical protein
VVWTKGEGGREWGVRVAWNARGRMRVSARVTAPEQPPQVMTTSYWYAWSIIAAAAVVELRRFKREQADVRLSEEGGASSATDGRQQGVGGRAAHSSAPEHALTRQSSVGRVDKGQRTTSGL